MQLNALEIPAFRRSKQLKHLHRLHECPYVKFLTIGGQEFSVRWLGGCWIVCWPCHVPANLPRAPLFQGCSIVYVKGGEPASTIDPCPDFLDRQIGLVRSILRAFDVSLVFLDFTRNNVQFLSMVDARIADDDVDNKIDDSKCERGEPFRFFSPDFLQNGGKTNKLNLK